MKRMSTYTHGVVDYVVSGIVGLLPKMLGLSPKVSVLLEASAGTSALYSAMTNYELGVVAWVTDYSQVRASYQRADASGAGTDGNDARQVAVGYEHYLSKRTALYATYAHLSNEGVAAFVVGTPPAAKAGASSSGYEFGIKHSF